MIPDQRRTALLQELHREKVLSVHQLTDLLEVSHMTVRRDIATLEREGLVLAVPGGVKLVTHVSVEPSRHDKTALRSEQKRVIAQVAAATIDDNKIIYLDAGTTMLEMVPLLTARSGLTVVTNDFGIVDALAMSGTPTIHIGGRVDHLNRSTVGTLATLILANLNVNVAFVSASSWSLKQGVTTPEPAKVDVKRAVIANAARKVLVADSSKYGSFSAYKVAALSAFDTIITDSGLSSSVVSAIRDQGVQLEIAGQ